MKSVLIVVAILVALLLGGAIGYRRATPREVYSVNVEGRPYRLVVESQPPPPWLGSPYFARIGFKGIDDNEWVSGGQWTKNCDSAEPYAISRTEGKLIIVEIPGFDTVEFDTSNWDDPSWHRRRGSENKPKDGSN
jgi:hypothetical protein